MRGIDLTVEAGEFVAFLGPNGAGKTTTLKLLSGVITPTAGTARVMGHVPWQRENAYRRRFALVMGQKNQLWWDLPAQESFRLHQQIYRIEPAAFDRTRDELVDLLERAASCCGQPVRELSLGERMKMELIAALLHSPEVLFLDEPTIGLDVIAQHNIQTFLRHYQQVRKITILLTSHYMKDVAALCRRVVIIAQRADHVRRLADAASSTASAATRSSRCCWPSDHVPGGLARYGEVLEEQPPKVRLRVDRRVVPEVLAAILATPSGGGRERRRSAAGGSDRRDVFAGRRRTKRRGEAVTRGERERKSPVSRNVCRTTSESPTTMSHRCRSLAPRHRLAPRCSSLACAPGGPFCGSAWKSGWSIGAISRSAR